MTEIETGGALALFGGIDCFGDLDGSEQVGVAAAHHGRITEELSDTSHSGDFSDECSSDSATTLARRILAVGGGNTAQRHVADVIARALDLADAIACDNNGDDDSVSEYHVAMAGIDALDTLESALAAAKSQLIAHSYTHAHEELLSDTQSPGQVVRHADGALDRLPSRAQIVATDLAVIARTTPGRARMLTKHAVQLCAHLPHTLGRLTSGELTAYQAFRISQEAHQLTPEQASALDEAVCAKRFTGAHYGLGAHRAATTTFTRRLSTAVRSLDVHQRPDTSHRTRGSRDRYIRFGLTADGMTSVHCAIPALDALAIDTVLDDYARTAPVNDDRTHEQRRADVFRTLFVGPAALSPPAQIAMNLEQLDAPAFDDEGGYTVIDERQNLRARGIYDTIRLLAACLDWTFPNTAHAVVNLDVTTDTLLDIQRSARYRQRRQTGPPTDTSSSFEPDPPPHSCSSPGLAAHRCPGSDPGRLRGVQDIASPSCKASGRERCAPRKDGPVDCCRRIRPSLARQPRASTAGTPELCDVSQDAIADSHGPHGPGQRYRPATVRGLGSISDDLAHALLQNADLRRILTEPRTGQPLEVSKRRPSQALRDAIINRDRQCRFPGCTRTTDALDLDHVIAFREGESAAGQTTPQNLHALCRAHHRAKHHLHWSPVMNDDGTITWRNNLLSLSVTT
ncbi:HNH endonuclease signature motif containing protein [Cumulibacter soli]|uniref:HNH endonuclease signature motif containing protein n=1 Tax=Cumulibacter soli TaxID=2546344 RepID=UPI0014193AFE|nr:HNH endonuclease signature motif containing protein [Cumulibacter soli]